MDLLSGKTIVFDLDGTLVDTAPDLIAATHHALDKIAPKSFSNDDLRPWISYGARRMIIEALKLSNVSAKPDAIDHMLARFLTFYENNIAIHSQPMAYIVQHLLTLKANGSRLAVCTNKRQALSELLLSELKMIDFFDAVVGRDAFPYCKPDPRHLLSTIERAGGNRDQAIMIGDSNVDIETAKNANVPSIGVTFGYSQVPISETKPTMVRDSFISLIDDVEIIFDQPSDSRR